MEIDRDYVRARFEGMSRVELLEEAALRADEYQPAARRILEAVATTRGIGPVEIDARRQAEASGHAAEPDDGIDAPALIASADDRDDALELAKALEDHGFPASVRELDPRAFSCSGHRVGHWGVMVAGDLATKAARLLERIAPQDAACGGGCASGGCGDAATGEEWPEDGDWWRTPDTGNDPQRGPR